MARNERPHVYQNRADGHDVYFMHYCPVCNGYYGVPHNATCMKKGGCDAWEPHNCACRKHREQYGHPREGYYGWIT